MQNVVRARADGGSKFKRPSTTPAEERLVFQKIEADRNPQANRQIGMAYLGTADPKLTKRTWDEVMQDIIKDKKGSHIEAMADRDQR